MRINLLQDIQLYSKDHPFVKFLIVLTFFSIYLIFTVINFGFEHGIMVALVTWSFFVLCTPIADAGVLIDFPLRIATGFRMIYSEIAVWILALYINIIGFEFFTTVYDSTMLLKLFRFILIHPWPYWIIILLSGIGSFLSIYFGDLVLDVIANKKDKAERTGHAQIYRMTLMIFIIALTVVAYYFLISQLNVDIPIHKT